MILAGCILGVVTFVGTAVLAAWSHARPAQNNRLLHDGPVLLMYILGAWLFVPLGWLWPAASLLGVVLCNLWFVVRVCPHCLYHARTDGPSLYCVLATRLAAPGDPQRFAARFRQTIGLQALNWFLPLVGGVLALRKLESLPYGLCMLALFGLLAFYLVPTASAPCCARCLNREACPHGRRYNAPPKA